MAYGNLYDFAYYDFFSVYWEIWIQERDYAGASTELVCGVDPLIINQQAREDDPFAVIKGSEAVVNVYDQAGFNFVELFTYDMKKYKLVVHKAGVLYWKGWIQPDTYQEPYLQPPYPVTIKFVDGLGSLKMYDYVDALGDAYTGYSPMNSIIYNCYNKIGLDYDRYESSDIYESTQTPADATSPFSGLYIRNSRYYTYKGGVMKAKNCYEVLEEILKTFHCEIKQDNGILHIRRIGQLKTSYVRRFYDEDNNYGAGESGSFNPVVINTANNVSRATLVRLVGDSMKIYPSIGKHSVSVNYGLKDNILINNDFAIHGADYDYESGNVVGYYPYEWTRNNLRDSQLFYIENTGLRLRGRYDSRPFVREEHWSPSEYLSQTHELNDSDNFMKFSLTWDITGSFQSVVQMRFLISIQGATNYYLNSAGQWDTIGAYIVTNPNLGIFELVSDEIPGTGTLYVQIYELLNVDSIDGSYVYLKEIKLQITGATGANDVYNIAFLNNVNTIDENNPNKVDLDMTLNDAPDLPNSHLYYDNAIFLDSTGETLTSTWDVRGESQEQSLYWLMQELYANYRKYSLQHISFTMYTKLIGFTTTFEDKDNSNKLFIPLRQSLNTKKGLWTIEAIQLPVNWVLGDETDAFMIESEDSSDYIKVF
jgi:hypothetical protein